MAKWDRRASDRELPPRDSRACRCLRRAPSRPAGRKLHHLFPMKPPIAGSRRHCSRAPLSPSSNGCGASSVRINNDEGTHAGSAWTSSSRFRRSICVVFLTEWRDDYNQVRPQSSLGPSVPDPASDLPVDPGPDRHGIPTGRRVVSTPVLGGLHHDYRFDCAA